MVYLGLVFTHTPHTHTTQQDNQLVTYSSSVGLLHPAASGLGEGPGVGSSGLLLHAVAGSNAGDTMKLLALNATDGT